MCGCWVVEESKSEENDAKRTSFFPMSDQSVMCEIKRDPMPQGEDNCVSASRWQAAVEVKLEVEAVQSA